MAEKINTIYIISKGRPECLTARYLTEMKYKGDWFIVCGNNDDKLDEYKSVWGDKIIVFDWYEEIKTTDTLDNFGFINKSSGAVPVRNATRRISEERGEIRHWQMDDDCQYIWHINSKFKKWIKVTGKYFENELYKLADFANKANIYNIGFAVSSDTRPENVKEIGGRVFFAHNMSNDVSIFTKWRGRLNDDLINAIETYRAGKKEYFIKYLMANMTVTQSNLGGNTDLYLEDGTIRKTAYAVLIDPYNVKLVVRHGRYHHKVNWRNIKPKLISDKYASK
jgi:hypothetical protein